MACTRIIDQDIESPNLSGETSTISLIIFDFAVSGQALG
jgi:hypothetical protein